MIGREFVVNYQIELVATASSGLPVSFASSDSSIADVSGSTVTMKQAGTVIITAS